MDDSNVVTTAGQTIPLPTGTFSALRLLMVAVNGNQESQNFLIIYVNNTVQTNTQSFAGRNLTPPAIKWIVKTVPQPSNTNPQSERTRMSLESDGSRSLRELELEVETEGRERMRRRLEEKMQAEVNRPGGVFPPRADARPGTGTSRGCNCAPPWAWWRWPCGTDKIRLTITGAVRFASTGV
jgi:hypothetical protein